MTKTRFAPSPTGFLHIGGARTALYSCLYALHNQGKTVLRIEDTDLERSTPEAVNAIIEGLDWLGLHFDEGPFYQTKRFDRYKEVIQQMLNEGSAYYCYCSKEELEIMRTLAETRKEKPRYNGQWRPEANKRLPDIPKGVDPVVRFKSPQLGVTSFNDLIHGPITVSNDELDDLIIARPDGTPTYNFCVVIDDMDMEITHVVRGDDHINNTPRQINIFKALNKPIPEYAHVAMILGDDGQKLSKRHGAVSVTQYRDEGFLPEAVLNYLVRLGWSHGDQEIFSFDEMVALFDLNDVNKSASAFNTSKLLWLNQHYMMNETPERLATRLKFYLDAAKIKAEDDAYLGIVAQAHVPRCHTMVELAHMIQYLFVDEITPEASAKNSHLTQVTKPILEALVAKFSSLDEWHSEPLKESLKVLTKELGIKMGQIGMPLRTAIVGREHSPNLDMTLILVGKTRTINRLNSAISNIR